VAAAPGDRLHPRQRRRGRGSITPGCGPCVWTIPRPRRCSTPTGCGWSNRRARVAG
jgi:hypothetical protein